MLDHTRRHFMILVGSVAATSPVATWAQQPAKLPTVGFLGAEASAWSSWSGAFVQRLRELGWIEGRTVAMEYRWTEGRPERHAEIAADFVRLKVDVIVTNATAVLTLKQATEVIPIVFALGETRSAAAWSQVWRDQAATSLDCRSCRSILPASVSNFCVRFSPGSAGWRSWEMLAFPKACWRWARFRP